MVRVLSDTLYMEDLDNFKNLFQGYLLALGMSRTAQVKRDARIGEAEAGRDSGIKVMNNMDQ